MKTVVETYALNSAMNRLRARFLLDIVYPQRKSSVPIESTFSCRVRLLKHWDPAGDSVGPGGLLRHAPGEQALRIGGTDRTC